MQAHTVAAMLTQTDPRLTGADAPQIVIIRTSGDKIQDRRLADIGGKALFTKEIERALVDNEIDMAVHSAKDLETTLAPGTVLASTLPREDVRDALIAPGCNSLADLPRGAIIGTASLRRQSQLLRARPDVQVQLMRGNVETRLAKLAAGDVQATFLAAAGLNRLGKADVIDALLDPDEMLPAAGQGAIAVQCRDDDMVALAILCMMNDPSAAAEVRAERALLAELGGSCHTPIAALARADISGRLHIRARVLRPDGSASWQAEGSGTWSDGIQLGRDIGASLSRQCDPDVLIGPGDASTG
jgi:hydroxymethylbilane synthase